MNIPLRKMMKLEFKLMKDNLFNFLLMMYPLEDKIHGQKIISLTKTYNFFALFFIKVK